VGRFAIYLFKRADEVELTEPCLARYPVEIDGFTVVGINIHLGLYQAVVEVKVGVCISAMHDVNIGAFYEMC